MKENKTYMQKADQEVQDLIDNGGYLPDEVALEFIRNTIKASTVLKTIQVVTMKSHTKILNKIGFSGRILHPGTSGRAVSEADRSKATTDNVELTTQLFKGEVRLSDEVLEDNIEGGQFKTTIMQMMADQISLDLDELTVNGDTNNLTDPFLAKINGMLKLATSHPVNAGKNPLSKAYLKSALKAMPAPYNRNKQAHVFMTSELAEIDYRDYLADRGTGPGDQSFQDDVPVRYANRPIMPIPVFPDNIGTNNVCTSVLLMDPKTAVAGFWRQIQIEPSRDAHSGEWCMTASVRFGFCYQEEDAVVQISNVKTQ